MDSEVSALNEADNANAKEVRSCRMGLSDIVLRADALDLKIDGFGNDIAQLFKDSAKMSAVQDIWHEIENLHKVDDDTTSELWSLRRRVELVENGYVPLRASVDRLHKDTSCEVDKLAQLAQRVDEIRAQNAESLENLETRVLDQQHDIEDTLVDLSKSSEEGLSGMGKRVADILSVMTGLANKTEVFTLQKELSGALENMKDKEQSVLFGAKCLSCNRAFDEVEKRAGVVDVQGEKQKAKLFAELTRALHCPNTDPTKPIKMLAVKVGRPGQLTTGNLGPIEGRDVTYACGVQDMRFLHANRSQAFSDASTDANSRPGTTPVPGRRCSSRRMPTPENPHSRPGTTGSQARQGRVPVKCQGGEVDFKHPLSELLGRDRGL